MFQIHLASFFSSEHELEIESRAQESRDSWSFDLTSLLFTGITPFIGRSL
jgi:hypothetical protein